MFSINVGEEDVIHVTSGARNRHGRNFKSAVKQHSMCAYATGRRAEFDNLFLVQVTVSPRQSTPKTLAPLAESVHEDGSRPTVRPSSSKSGRTASPSGRDIGTASSSGQSHGSVQPSPQLSEHIKKLGEEDDNELISALSEHEMWRSVTGMIKLVQVRCCISKHITHLLRPSSQGPPPLDDPDVSLYPFRTHAANVNP
jgi:hypothetical protein